MVWLPALFLALGIAAEPDSIWSLAADEREVLWANSTELKAAPAEGGEPRTVARLPAGAHDDPAAFDLELTPTHAVWWNGASIYSVKRQGGKPRRIGGAAHDYQAVAGIVTDGVRIYFRQSSKVRGTEHWSGEIWSVPVAGGTRKRLARLPDAPSNLVLAGEQLYWSSGASVFRMKRSGGAIAVVVEDELAPRLGSGITRLAVIGDDVYYELDGVVKRNRAAVAGLKSVAGLGAKGFYQADGDTLVLIPRDGGAARPIAKDLPGLRGVRPIGRWIYFQAGGSIRRIEQP